MFFLIITDETEHRLFSNSTFKTASYFKLIKLPEWSKTKNVAPPLQTAENREGFNHRMIMDTKVQYNLPQKESLILVVCDAFTEYGRTKPAPQSDVETATDVVLE